MHPQCFTHASSFSSQRKKTGKDCGATGYEAKDQPPPVAASGKSSQNKKREKCCDHHAAQIRFQSHTFIREALGIQHDQMSSQKGKRTDNSQQTKPPENGLTLLVFPGDRLGGR